MWSHRRNPHEVIEKVHFRTFFPKDVVFPLFLHSGDTRRRFGKEGTYGIIPKKKLELPIHFSKSRSTCGGHFHPLVCCGPMLPPIGLILVFAGTKKNFSFSTVSFSFF